MFAGVIARRPLACHAAKNCLEHVVHELALAPRVHHLFVVGLLFETQDVLREEPERASDVGLEGADRPRPPRARADSPVEFVHRARRPRPAHRGPPVLSYS